MLVALAPVAAAACWALWRPAKRTTTVPALSLWREALASLARDRQHRTRRVRAAWLCLLCGAVAVAAAMAQPKVQTTRQRRHVVVAVYPSAELAGDDGEMLHKAAGLLLARLSPTDRVQLVLPDVLGGRSEWLSPAQAGRRIDELPILPARADELSVDIPLADEGPTIVLAPAGLGISGGGNVSLIELPTSLPAVTVDQVAAAALPDGGVQVFVALRNHTARPADVTVRAEVLDAELRRLADGAQTVTVPPGEWAAATQTLAAGGEVIVVALTGPADEAPMDFAYLVRRPATIRRVAMIGADDPMVRRYIASDDSLELVAEAADADIVIANGLAAPGGKAALVFGAAAVRPFRDDVTMLQHAQLGDADIAEDHPVMAGVDLTGTAVRELPVWQGAGSSLWAKVLAGIDGGAFIVVDEANRPGQTLGRGVYVLPDIASANTNWTMMKSFVAFMANAMRWLAPGDDAAGIYACRAPIDAGRPVDWRPVNVAGRSRGRDTGPLLPAGVYVDSAGTLHAVSLVALRWGQPDVPVERAVGLAALGEASGQRVGLEIWPILAGLGAALWLVGWTLRVVR